MASKAASTGALTGFLACAAARALRADIAA
jgi:hypothetical protein